MEYKLLISIDVLEFIERLPRHKRLGLRTAISNIGDNPLGVSDATDFDANGRLVQILVVGEYAFTDWIDDMDRHVKILDIHSADH